MTREERIAILKDIIDGEIIHPQVRKDVGTWAIEALSSSEIPNRWIDAEVLDKIRAEIEQSTSRYSISKECGGIGHVEWSDRLIKESNVLQIIDKYMAESEDKE